MGAFVKIICPLINPKWYIPKMVVYLKPSNRCVIKLSQNWCKINKRVCDKKLNPKKGVILKNKNKTGVINTQKWV